MQYPGMLKLKCICDILTPVYDHIWIVSIRHLSLPTHGSPESRECYKSGAKALSLPLAGEEYPVWGL